MLVYERDNLGSEKQGELLVRSDIEADHYGVVLALT